MTMGRKGLTCYRRFLYEAIIIVKKIIWGRMKHARRTITLPARRSQPTQGPDTRAGKAVSVEPVGGSDHDAPPPLNSAVMLVRVKLKTLTNSLLSTGMSLMAFPLTVK